MHEPDEETVSRRAYWDRFLRDGAAGIPAPLFGGSLAAALVIMVLVAAVILKAIGRERTTPLATPADANAERAQRYETLQHAQQRVQNSPAERAAREAAYAADQERRKREEAEARQLQSEREQWLQQSIDLGVVAKYERKSSTWARVWVGPRFYALTFDEKQAVVSVVFAHYFDGKDWLQRVEVVENMNGKVIGRYSVQDGGLKMF